MILSGYRIHFYSYRGLFKSAFMCHNETFNIWSHFLGKLMFLAMTIFVLTYYPNDYSAASQGSAEFLHSASINSTEDMTSVLNLETSTLNSTIDTAQNDLLTNYHNSKSKLIIPAEKERQELIISSAVAEYAEDIEKTCFQFVTYLKTYLTIENQPETQQTLFEAIKANIVSLKTYITEY